MQRSRTASISRREFIGAVGAGFVWSAEQSRATFPKSTDTSTELIFISATKLAQSIRDKKATSLEVLRAHLAQIEKVNPKLNAVVQLCAERALAEARESDALLARGQVKGSSGSFEERAQEPLPMPEFADLLERQDAVGSKLLQWMKSYDIVLSPAAGKPAQPIDSPSPPVSRAAITPASITAPGGPPPSCAPARRRKACRSGFRSWANPGAKMLSWPLASTLRQKPAGGRSLRFSRELRE